MKRIIRQCVTCLKFEGQPYSYGASPDLPCDHVSDNPPFTYTGIDFAGPLFVRVQGSDQSEYKTYMCLFTCASTRAIHLELVRSLSVDQFLLAFRHFASRRGLPSVLWSDNAKTFKSSAKEIQRILGAPEIS